MVKEPMMADFGDQGTWEGDGTTAIAAVARTFCRVYVRMLLLPKEKPFEDGVALDGDDPEHIQWV